MCIHKSHEQSVFSVRMGSGVHLSALLAVSALLIAIILPWAKNLRAAKATGLPYVIVPFFAYNRITSLFMLRIVIRFANKFLLEPSATSGRTLSTASWPWKLQYTPFAKLGDTFLTVAPGGIIVNTADADVISQIMARGVDFPKASHLYKTVDIYGENILAAEGETWRRHRKLMSPLFSEKNNQLVWKQTLECCDALLSSWTSEPDKIIRTLAKDANNLSLNVIEHAGLGQNEVWPSFAESQVGSKKELHDGHTMTFHTSLTSVLDHLLYIILLPKWFLANAPFQGPRLAYQSYCEWGTYMVDTVEKKRSSMERGKSTPFRNDLLSQIVKASQDGSTHKTPMLTQSEILGNLFVMVIAGHETSANSIHFSLLLLAIYPHVQKEVQQELDEQFEGRLKADWKYEHDFPWLLESKLAAVLNEELRLFAPTVTLPKLSTSVPHQLWVNGKEVTVPPKTMLRVCISSVHRNPKFWDIAPSHQQSRLGHDNDLEEFRPERWMRRKAKTSSKLEIDTKATQPYKNGAYLPFSEGARACIGRRFAQVEVLAALAGILSEYSVELAVDEWASAEEVAQMTKQEKAKLWQQAATKAAWTLQNKTAVLITLQMRGAFVPVRIVRRGGEVFADTVE